MCLIIVFLLLGLGCVAYLGLGCVAYVRDSLAKTVPLVAGKLRMNKSPLEVVCR